MAFSRISTAQKQIQRAQSVIYKTENSESQLCRTLLTHSRGFKFRGKSKKKKDPSLGEQIRLGLIKSAELLPEGIVPINEQQSDLARIKNMIFYSISLLSLYICLVQSNLTYINGKESLIIAITLFFFSIIFYFWGH